MVVGEIIKVVEHQVRSGDILRLLGKHSLVSPRKHLDPWRWGRTPTVDSHAMPRNLFIAKRYSYTVSCVLMASGRTLDTRTLEDPRCYNWVGTLPEAGDLSRIQGRCGHGRRQIGQGGDAPESCKKSH